MERYTLVMLTAPEIITPDISAALSEAMLGGFPIAAINLDLYKARAQVEAQNPDDLFARCQHISPEPDPDHPMKGLRSLSVGDFIVSETGTVRLCAPVGWKGQIRIINSQIRKIAATYEA